MRCKLDAEATITTITINLGARLNYRDQTTHRVLVQGHMTHAYFPQEAIVRDVSGAGHKVRGQPFTVELHAEADLCEAIKALVGKYLAADVEEFPNG